MEAVKMVCGDAVQEMKRIPEASVDLIVADPPYNLGKDFGSPQGVRSFEDYLDFTRSWVGEAKRILTHKGTLYVFMGFRFISYLFNILERECDLNFNNWICWHYTQGLGRLKGFSARHEDILMFTKTKEFSFYLDPVRIPQKSYRSRNNMRGANPGDVWKFSHVHYNKGVRQKHPTQKPEGVIERMVLASTRKGDFVVDPFSGSGTTLRVCQQLGRKCLGIDLNSAFLEAAKVRLSQEFKGFDSVDERKFRFPSGFGNPQLKASYLERHKVWFGVPKNKN